MSDGNIGSKTIMVVFNPLWTFDLKQQIAVAIEESSLGWSVQYLSNLNCQTTNIVTNKNSFSYHKNDLYVVSKLM